jgi:hypothetical protein
MAKKPRIAIASRVRRAFLVCDSSTDFPADRKTKKNKINTKIEIQLFVTQWCPVSPASQFLKGTESSAPMVIAITAIIVIVAEWADA